MPDFEALIKHQQSKLTPSNDRLRILKPNGSSKELGPINNKYFLTSVIGSLLGSSIGTLAILIASEKGLMKSIFQIFQGI